MRIKTQGPLPNVRLTGPKLLLMALPLSSSFFAAPSYGEVRFAWEEVPSAAYYQGSYELNGDVVPFRTTSAWLLLDPRCTLTLSAYSANGAVLQSVDTNSSSSTVAQVHARTESQPQPPAAAITPTPQSPNDDSNWDPSADDGSADAPATATSEHKVPPRAFLAVSYGLGKEWLEAYGGVTSYSDASTLGSTTVAGEWQGEDAAWYLQGSAEAHNFQTANSTATGNGSKYLRPTARGIVFYDLNARAKDARTSHIGLGAGVNYFQMPILAIDNQVADTAKLKDKTVAGPILALSAATTPSSNNHVTYQISFQPVAFTWGVKALSATADVDYQHDFSRTFFAVLGADLQRTRLQGSQDCLAAANCQNFSQSTSTVFLARIGVGLKL